MIKLYLGANIATMQDNDLGMISNGAIVVEGESIVWVGALNEVPEKYREDEIVDLQGLWVTPALIDCHTHLISKGSRSKEFEARMQGASYESIAHDGGGISRTVEQVANASFDELLSLASPKFLSLINEGVSVVEVKSGYASDFENEMKMLKVAKALGEQFNVKVIKTFLGAHVVPKGISKAQAIAQSIEWMENLYEAGLVDCVDAFCESIAYSPSELAPYFEKAESLGLLRQCHVEQLSHSGGVQNLPVTAFSHLEWANEADVALMAKNGASAVLLPFAYYWLKCEKKPPIELFRKFGVPMAISTDANPGSAPCYSLRTNMNMAARLFEMTPTEILRGVTANAAQALGLIDRGEIKAGFAADFVIWSIDHPRDLVCEVGVNPIVEMIIKGKPRYGNSA